MQRKHDTLFRYFVLMVVSTCLLSFAGCTIKEIVTTDQEGKKLTVGAYRKTIIHPYEADHDLAQKHPDAAVLCENATIQELLRIGTIPMIVKTSSSAFLRESDTVIIKVRLTYIHEIKQIRGKTKTGPAIMTAQVRLIDTSTGKKVHDQYISLAHQSSLKSAEDPSELGKLIALHVSTVIQNQ